MQKGKTKSAGRAANKRGVMLWLTAELVEQLNKAAKAAGLPRTVFIENQIREELGLPPVDISPNTPRVYRRKGA